MTRGELDGDDVLMAARRGLSPTASDAARVRQLTEAVLAAGAVASTVTQDPPAAAAGASLPLAARALPWVGRAAAIGAIAAIAGGVGYRAGWHAGWSEAIERPPAAGLEVPPARRPTPVVRSASTSASIGEEVRALRSAERALREHQPAFALALLRELDRSVPNGQLTEERLAVRTIARCASRDVPLGVNLADDFADQYPDSVYGRRVAESCAATDSGSSGDQERRRESR